MRVLYEIDITDSEEISKLDQYLDTVSSIKVLARIETESSLRDSNDISDLEGTARKKPTSLEEIDKMVARWRMEWDRDLLLE